MSEVKMPEVIMSEVQTLGYKSEIKMSEVKISKLFFTCPRKVVFFVRDQTLKLTNL